MNIEQGKTYQFDVLYKMERGIGNGRLKVQDADGSQYECNLFPFQEDDMPSVVWCKWLGEYTKGGLPSLVQDKGKIMRGMFKVGGEYEFRVKSEQQEDCNTMQKYYMIEDTRWGIRQRYYSSKEYESDEILRLKVKNIREDKGFLELETATDKKTTTSHRSKIGSAAVGTSVADAATSSASGIQYTPGKFGCEGQKVEFKTSIVFTPGDSQPNIDKQLPDNIVRTIAGFLNADGGTLYIGVDDKGNPVGMAKDYAYLNDTNLTPDDYPYYDRYVGSYGPTTDKYELKIRNAVKRLLSQRASENIQFEFPQEYAGEVCIICIKPLKRPVFFKGCHLYLRSGNETLQYRDDAIISFIQDRLELQIHDVLDSEQLGLLGRNNITIDDIKKVMREAFFDAPPAAIPATTTPSVTIPIPTVSATPKNDEVWNYFTYYATGEYSIQKEEMHNGDIVAQVCVHKSEKNQRILLCYDNGCVASVVPSDIYKSKHKGRRPKGWNTDAKLMNVFVANTFDMLGAISIDHATNGRWVKVHNVSDLGTPKQSMNSKGNIFIHPKLGIVSEYKFIPDSHRNIIPNLIFLKVDTTTTLGVPETTQQHLNEVAYFQKIGLPPVPAKDEQPSATD